MATTDSIARENFESLLLDNASKRNYRNIPYYEAGTYSVFLRSNDVSSDAGALENQELVDRAINRFIQHFFPEYYPFMGTQEELLTEEEKAEFAPFEVYYTALRAEFDGVLQANVKLKPGNIKNKITYRTTLDLYALREEYETDPDEVTGDLGTMLPSFSTAKAVLNRKLERSPNPAAVSTIRFQNLPTALESLTNSLTPFGSLLNQLQQREGTPSMNSMQTGVSRIVKKVTDTVHDSINWTEKRQSFYDTDYFTVTFNGSTEIVGISYFVLGAEASASEEAKIGYITNIRFNPLFKDPFSLFLLKNQQELIDGSMDPGLGEQDSVLDFLNRIGLDSSVGFGQALSGDAVYGLDSTPGGLGGTGPFAIPPRNKDDYVDVSEYNFEAILYAQLGAQGLLEGVQDPAQVARTREMMNDPVFKAKIAQAEKARRINTTVQVLDVMSDIGNMDFFHFMNQTKEGRKINKVLSSFGIQDLAQEALMCLTLGIGSSVSKITDSVRDGIVNGSSVSLNTPPTPPSLQINLQRPSFDTIKIGSYFSITGDPPLKKRIVDMLLGVVAQAAFEVVKGLAEFIKFNCLDLLNADRGTVQCGDEIRNRNQHATASFPNLPELLAGIASNYGLGVAEAYTYMNDVSQILTPIELCRLLNQGSMVTEETIENILDFNEDYSDEMVRQHLNSRNAILSFFQSMSSNIDTTTLCTEIVQQTLLVAVEGCEICLGPDDLAAIEPGIAALIDLAENGFQPPPPTPPDLLCPESDSYLSNPIAEITIPNLFNQFMDTAAIYMAGSLEAARTAMLEAIIRSSISPIVQDACTAAGVDLEPTEVDPASLDIVDDVLNFIQTVSAETLDLGEHCPDISSAKFDSMVEDITIIVNAINTALDEVPGAIAEIQDKVNAVRTNIGSGETGVPHAEYVFPQAYRQDFASAIVEGYEVDKTVGDHRILATERFSHSSSINENESGWNALLGLYDNPNGNGTVLKYEFDLTPTDANNYVRISFPEWTDSGANSVALQLEYQLPSLGSYGSTSPPSGFLYGSETPGSDSLTDPWSELIGDHLYKEINLNPYVYRFIRPLYSLLDPTANNAVIHAVSRDHPEVYHSLIRGIYDYILRYGSFSAGGSTGINNLKLFKNNSNCTPENVGDLFDADGIIDQMKKEFAAAACFDGGSSKDKVRNSLYFGFINMLIQATIDEFIISNIVVLTALDITDVLDPRYPFREILTNQVVGSISKAILDGNPNIEVEIFNYFDRRARRPSTIEAGGFTHSFSPSTVVPGFESPSFPLNNIDLLRFLVEERLGYRWGDQNERSTLQTIRNVIDPDSKAKSFQDIFLQDVLWGASLPDQPDSSADPDQVQTPAELEAFIQSLGPDEHYHTNLNNPHYIPTRHRNIDNINNDGQHSPDGEYVPHNHPTVPALSDSIPAPIGITEIPPDPQDPGSAVFSTLLALHEDPAEGRITLKLLEAFHAERTLMSWTYPDAIKDDLQQKFEFIKEQPDYQEFFHQAFNIHTCFMVPLMHNLFLSNKYFPRVRGSFVSVRKAIINMFNMTEATSRPPLLEPRDAGFSNTLANNGQQDMGSMAAEIFLKFLRETPIQILKGLVELIDPHVAISKIIKDVTGSVFVELAKGIQASLPAPLKDKGITGEDVLGFIFCLYNIANASSSVMTTAASPVADAGDSPLFGPKLEVSGLDFTGTVTGMFMIPPSPLGLVYLLIQWLISLAEAEEDDTGEEEAESATDESSNSCPEGTTDLDTVYTE